MDESECTCPSCGGHLSVHDHRVRRVILKSGRKVTLLVPRGRCPKCRRLHVELPNFVVPFKHYEAQAIQDVVDGPGKMSCPAEDSTMRRWIAEFRRLKPKLEVILRLSCGGAFPLFGPSLLERLRRKAKHWASSVMPLLTVRGLLPAT